MRLVVPACVPPPSDLSHQSASYCTYCSRSHSSDPAEWVRMQLGDDVWRKQQRPVMSLYVRTVISSTCKCILVEVGPLIYSSKCNFINLPLILLSTHHKSRPGERRHLIPLGDAIEVFFSRSRGKHGKERNFFTSNVRLGSRVACVRLCNCFIFNRTNMQPGWWESSSDEGSRCVPRARLLLLLSLSACFRYALLVFAAAVHETLRRMAAADYS